jgi:two-component system cell cycle response regulator DivK
MAHAFGSNGFGQLVVDAERLVARAADHECGLASLADRLQTNDSLLVTTIAAAAPAVGPYDAVTAGGGVPPSPDHLAALLTTLQQLVASASEQRRIAESLRDRLAGAPATNGHEPRRPLVLVVDDSKDNRDVAALLLETSGFDAITASNGLEGLIVAHYTRPAVVLMDVAMPILDGIQATRLLRASPVTQRINVIAHTARADLDSIAMSRLFESVLPKPASPDTMLAVVQRYSAPQGEL